jgi:dTMP kinase
MGPVNGRLVVFEGLDGCGKSTQLERAAERLRAGGYDPFVTREPTDGAWGRRIREMAKSGRAVAPEEELRWFVEDRREHAERELRPALSDDRLVLCDRYFVSSVAYQGARGLDWLGILAESEAEFPLPDLVLLFEIAPEQGLERVHARGGELETVFERADFLERVAKIFAAIDRPYLERIDATGPPDGVEALTREALVQRLGLTL